MADTTDTPAPTDTEIVPQSEPAIVPQSDTAPAPRAPSGLLAGTELLLGKETQYAVAVQVASDGELSTLMIDPTGEQKTCYITKPIKLQAAKFKTYLEKKKVTLPDSVSQLVDDTTISCDAFYVSAGDGPLLLMFAIQFKEGLIKSLTGDEDLAELFDVKGASVRVFRCPAASFDVLESYVAELGS